jgi:serine/threonine-protein kinase
MGEVYRARDTRLGRDVAIKVLPDAVARDPERLARFRREARVLASLSHPGIGAIFGLAGADGVEALVLELVEGPTLAERIDGRPLPLAEALAIGRRLGAALEAAHARGILHRDLKPANVKLAPDGTVKILDFGLAKARGPSKDPDPDADPERESSDITAITGNLVFGTPAYMSPERVSRGEADERSDIWAFGCILYEMLTGVRAFPGESVAEAFARILEREPDYGRLPADTPEAVRRLLRRTLEKDPARRLTRLHDGLIDLADEIDRPAALGVPARSTGRTLVLLGVAAAVLAAGAWGVMMATRAGPPPAVTKLAIPLPPGDTPVTGFQPMMAVSSDSRVIVYRARRGSQVQLFRRSLQDLEPRAIAGTESGTSPFFSPDGTWLGFDADGVLKRVPIDGGPASTICDAPGGATATWLYDDTIVFATNTSRVLQRVPASGGTPAPLTTLDAGRGETLHLLIAGTWCSRSRPGRRVMWPSSMSTGSSGASSPKARTGATSHRAIWCSLAMARCGACRLRSIGWR